jgi:hypothetical protein
MSKNIDWCKRLRGLASGETTGEIPSIEYALAADHIEVLQNCIEMAINAYERGGLLGFEVDIMKKHINYDE